MEKKAKAQAKRTRRKELKENPDENPPSWQVVEVDPEEDDPETPDEAN